MPASVDIRLGTRLIGFEAANGGYKLELRQGGKAFSEHARIIIGADGAASSVRRLVAGRQPFPRKYIAVQEWIETKCAVPYFSTFFDPAITDFYGWTIPKEEMILVGAALSPRNDVVKKFKQMKQGLVRQGLQLGKTIAREGAVINRPVSLSQIYTGTGGVALLGEAAGWISPSSAEGISYAFKSARYLAEAFNQDPAGLHQRYARKTRNMRFNIILKNLKSPFMYNKWLRRIILRSGVNNVNVINSQ